jgi:hypothetical protein
MTRVLFVHKSENLLAFIFAQKVLAEKALDMQSSSGTNIKKWYHAGPQLFALQVSSVNNFVDNNTTPLKQSGSDELHSPPKQLVIISRYYPTPDNYVRKPVFPIDWTET